MTIGSGVEAGQGSSLDARPAHWLGALARGWMAIVTGALLTTVACNGSSDRQGDTDVQVADSGVGLAPESRAGAGAGTGPGDTASGAGGNAGGAVPASCSDLQDTILATEPTRAAMAAAFGAPDSVAAAVEPNRHVAGAVDSLFTLYYPGLELHIRTPQGARDMATGVRVRDNRYLAWPGIGIGAARERLLEVLGNAREETADAMTWDCSEHVEQPVTFQMAGGRVRSIEISYYVD